VVVIGRKRDTPISRGSRARPSHCRHRSIRTRLDEVTYRYVRPRRGFLIVGAKSWLTMRASTSRQFGFKTSSSCRSFIHSPHEALRAKRAFTVHEPASGLGLLASVLFGKATGWNYSTPSEAEVYTKKTENFTQQTTRASCAGCSGSILTASALTPTLLVGCRGIQERASFTEKGKFTEPEHSVFGTSVEVSNIHEIVPGFGHEPDDFRD